MPNTGGNLKIWVAPVIRTVQIFARFYADPTNETTTNFGLYYSFNSGGDELLVTADNIDTTCQGVAAVYVPPGTTFHIGFLSVGGKLQTPYNFDGTSANAGDEIDCPNTLNYTYCGTNNVGGTPLSVNISGNNVNIALTIAVVKGSFVGC